MLMRKYASSRVKRRSFYRKSELQMFLLISSGHIGGQFLYFLCRVYCVTVKTKNRPLHCKWAFKKIEAFKKILYPPIEQCSNTTPHWRFGDIYRRPGLLTITWVNWKFGWKIKWFVPFYLGSVRNL